MQNIQLLFGYVCKTPKDNKLWSKFHRQLFWQNKTFENIDWSFQNFHHFYILYNQTHFSSMELLHILSHNAIKGRRKQSYNGWAISK